MQLNLLVACTPPQCAACRACKHRQVPRLARSNSANLESSKLCVSVGIVVGFPHSHIPIGHVKACRLLQVRSVAPVELPQSLQRMLRFSARHCQHTLVACASTPGQSAQSPARQKEGQLLSCPAEVSSTGAGTLKDTSQPLQAECTPRHTACARTPAEAAQGLPIQEALGQVLAALDAGKALVLQAPPCAGKTTACHSRCCCMRRRGLQGKLVLVRTENGLFGTRCAAQTGVLPLQNLLCRQSAPDGLYRSNPHLHEFQTAWGLRAGIVPYTMPHR